MCVFIWDVFSCLPPPVWRFLTENFPVSSWPLSPLGSSHSFPAHFRFIISHCSVMHSQRSQQRSFLGRILLSRSKSLQFGPIASSEITFVSTSFNYGEQRTKTVEAWIQIEPFKHVSEESRPLISTVHFLILDSSSDLLVFHSYSIKQNPAFQLPSPGNSMSDLSVSKSLCIPHQLVFSLIGILKIKWLLVSNSPGGEIHRSSRINNKQHPCQSR